MQDAEKKPGAALQGRVCFISPTHGEPGAALQSHPVHTVTSSPLRVFSWPIVREPEDLPRFSHSLAHHPLAHLSAVVGRGEEASWTAL